MNKSIIVAWFAGLFEGEGTFIFHKDKPKGISLTSTDIDVLEKIQLNFGGSIYKSNHTNAKPNWKQAYIWQFKGKDSRNIVLLIKPFLCKRRLERAEEWLKKYEDLINIKNNKSIRIKEVREKINLLRKQGLKHKQIAEITGYERSHITKILNGA